MALSEDLKIKTSAWKMFLQNHTNCYQTTNNHKLVQYAFQSDVFIPAWKYPKLTHI